jgi:hypothetical protein
LKNAYISKLNNVPQSTPFLDPNKQAPDFVVSANSTTVETQRNEQTMVKEINAEQVNEVKKDTRESITNLKGEMKNLADLNNDKNIDATLRDVVNEDVLLRTLSRVTNGGEEEKMKEVFKRVTGNDVTTFNPDEVKEFQTKLRTSLMVINQLTSGNAGLIALLTGNLEGYMANIQKIPTEKRNINVDTLKGLSPTAQTIVGTLVTTGALVLTGGVLVVGHESENMTYDSFIRKLETSNDNSIW